MKEAIYHVYSKWSDSERYWISEYYTSIQNAMEKFLSILDNCVETHNTSNMSITKKEDSIDTDVIFTVEPNIYYTISIKKQ